VDSHRAESFSDGVFAVAITLLVFSLLRVDSRELTYRTLGDGWPQYAAYVVSFLTIGIVWVNHHILFGHVSRVDRPLLVLNLLLLMGVVAIPFPTALLAEHLTGRYASGGGVAAVVYGAVMIAISVSFNAIGVYMVRHPGALVSARSGQLLRGAILHRDARASAGMHVPRWSIGAFGYLAGALVGALVGAAAALAVYGLLAVFYIFSHLPEPSEASPGLDGLDQGSPPAL
jgi:uncharacterized membrane protein